MVETMQALDRALGLHRAGRFAAATPGTGRAQLKALTLEAAALLRRERMAAILSGRDRHVSLDGVRRLLVGDAGNSVTIPRDRGQSAGHRRVMEGRSCGGAFSSRRGAADAAGRGTLLALLRSWFKQDIMRDMARWTPTNWRTSTCIRLMSSWQLAAIAWCAMRTTS